MRRLLHDAVDAGAIFRRVAGVHEDGRGRGAKLNDMGHFETRHTRHLIIGDDEVVDFGIEGDERGFRAAGGFDGVAEAAKKPFGAKAAHVAIVDQEHGLGLRRGHSLHKNVD